MKISFTLDWERALHWFHGCSLFRKRIIWVVNESLCVFLQSKMPFSLCSHWDQWANEMRVFGSVNWMYQWMSVCLRTVNPIHQPPSPHNSHCICYWQVEHMKFTSLISMEKKPVQAKIWTSLMMCHRKYTPFQVAQFSPANTEVHPINISQTVKWQENTLQVINTRYQHLPVQWTGC